MSNALIWQIIRKNNAYLVKRDHVIFSKERGNVANLNRQRFSGLANHHAVDIHLNKNGTKIEASLKKNFWWKHPAKLWKTTNIKRNKSTLKKVRHLLKHSRVNNRVSPAAQLRAYSLIRQIARTESLKKRKANKAAKTAQAAPKK
ncbi:MAG: hypothetical protein EZS28_031235 [Streblomastix strix]|uniref:Ribosomal eL28/Mak16 domain-containing protein n=1 Tax=Streblomastix strix TaxID=222440 RepID=A0A5J4US54_9EUKA|nr:MAG: hypothetical protein EZS28_031235 [Streblomastix strix]